MAIMTMNGIFGWATLILILAAIAMSVSIIIRTDKRLCTCHKFFVLALIIFGVIKFSDIFIEFQIITLAPFYREILEALFVLLFILGFWNIYQGIKERQAIPREPKKTRRVKR